MGVGKYLSHEDLIAAFTLRSKRLVAQEALGEYIAEAAPDEKIERLLFVEDNIIGAENKRQLSSYVAPVLNSAAFENYFQNPKVPLLQRLQRLAQLQARMRRSGFIDVTREEVCGRMDHLAVQMEARGKLFDSIEARTPRPCGKGPDPAQAGDRRHSHRGRACGPGAGADPGASVAARISHRLHGGADPNSGQGWRCADSER